MSGFISVSKTINSVLSLHLHTVNVHFHRHSADKYNTYTPTVHTQLVGPNERQWLVTIRDKVQKTWMSEDLDWVFSSTMAQTIEIWLCVPTDILRSCPQHAP